MYFVTVNADESIATRLISGIHSIPDFAIQISDEDWLRTSQETDGVWFVSPDGVCEKRPYPQATPEQLAATARSERDRQLREVYDPGIQIVRRELEMTSDPVYTAQLIAKRGQLNQYAKDLQGVPEQAAFPQTITWPEIPTKDLE